MKSLARYVFHFVRNTLLPNYRYYRLSVREKGSLLFYDRDRRTRFRVHSRGFIDSVTANQIFSNNEYNMAMIGRTEQAHEMYERILARGRIPLIIDCGANIGLSPQYFAREFPKARIVALEPDAANLEMATINCVDFPQITLIGAAVGSQAGYAAITNHGADANAFRVDRINEDADTERGIPFETVSGVYARFPDADLFIVKVDIEGFERDLFESNTDWIDDCDILVVELHDWMLPTQASSRSFITALAGRDRDFLFKGENVFSFRNRR